MLLLVLSDDGDDDDCDDDANHSPDNKVLSFWEHSCSTVTVNFPQSVLPFQSIKSELCCCFLVDNRDGDTPLDLYYIVVTKIRPWRLGF